MAHIMAVPGHKSASSVAVYQRVSSKEKQVMGAFIIPYYDIDSVKRKYFCFCQPRCYCFLGPK
jgi:hypothetical protein